jgi:phosphonoacetaldehyde hydrolase
MLKKYHIRALLQIPRIRSLWCELFNRNPDENDIEELYADFEPMLLSILPDYTELVPEALELINKLSEKGIKIGSTTGYTAEMMKIVIRNAKEKGNSPDFVATSDEVPAGRPFPWMCYLNAIKLEVFPMDTIVKVGDTISDIKAFGN